MTAKFQTGCKINLGLRILDKRADGYHNLETIFYPLSVPCDEVEIEKRSALGVRFACNIEDIDPENNTLTKAYALYHAENPLDFGLNVRLTKNVPHGAGLGGGSANAGLVLAYLQREAQNPLPFETLVGLASKVGADVPFFLYNCPCKAEGIGEKLLPIALDFSAYFLLLVMPDIHISTVWAFKKLAEQKKLLTSKTKKDTKARSLMLDANYFVNDFESIVFQEYHDLAKTKQIMIREGAVFASLSGTGSALFGLFEKEEQLNNAVNALSGQEFFVTWNHVCKKL